MNYIGSKLKLLTFLYSSIESILKKYNSKNLKDSIFCDIFAGTGVVGKFFKSQVKHIIANDKEYYSFILNQNYIAIPMDIKDIKALFQELQSDSLTPPLKGFIYENYCLGKKQLIDSNTSTQKNNLYKRQYFSDYNGAKIDAIRTKIELWKQKRNINDFTYYHLLASLLESADRVANTASVYGAFLKQLKKSALKKMCLTPANYEANSNKNFVYHKNSLELIKEIQGDILYLDPPYNAREYGANYHLLNTIAYYDNFIPRGKTGLRYYEKSSFCKKSEVYEALDFLVKNAHFNYIFLSYNDEGLLKSQQIRSIFEKYGKYELRSQIYQRFKADCSRNHKQDSTIEHIHILKK